ncbi:MAG: hypothetical protein GX591_20280 [Planctomycetes bacterium]|nr:hypothetical protein [Planctomycetota bacterium]
MKRIEEVCLQDGLAIAHGAMISDPPERGKMPLPDLRGGRQASRHPAKDPGEASSAQQAFPDHYRGWFADVSQPPFKLCLTTLWGEPKIADLWGAAPGAFRPLDPGAG